MYLVASARAELVADVIEPAPGGDMDGSTPYSASFPDELEFSSVVDKVAKPDDAICELFSSCICSLLRRGSYALSISPQSAPVVSQLLTISGKIVRPPWKLWMKIVFNALRDTELS